MRICEITVENFRGIRYAELKNIGRTVVIAGVNGCGKSCIFDAVRLFKAIYGSYSNYEWNMFLSEFNINQINGQYNIDPLLYDKSIPIKIRCKLAISPEERKYIIDNMEDLALGAISPAQRARRRQAASQEMNEYAEAQRKWLSANADTVVRELAQEFIEAEVALPVDKGVNNTPSPTLELLFGNYLPRDLGIMDYHGPNRAFSREIIQNLSVDLNQQQQERLNHSLYNVSSKYNNIKTEMASAYVHEIIAERAGVELGVHQSLTSTLSKLFELFFPDKQFKGPIPMPDGSLDFPVYGQNGTVHDLNELSSGEKEILYGYLRMRASAPQYSIIMLDEPELHLNPKLIRSLPSFYSQYIGKEFDNQVWLITHSDTLIREAVGKAEYSVYHMSPAHTVPADESQSREILVGTDIERIVIDLVGDLATYRPGGKLVIFEGGGETDFDLNMVLQLFPEVVSRINAVSGGSRRHVSEIHSILSEATARGKIPFKVLSVVDHDSDPLPENSSERFQWDVYHIENYLIVPEIVFNVYKSLGKAQLKSIDEVDDALRRAARGQVKNIVNQKIRSIANGVMVGAINVGFDPGSIDPASAQRVSIERSFAKISHIVEVELSRDRIEQKRVEIEGDVLSDLAGDGWKSRIPGRNILKAFSAEQGLQYEILRDAVLQRMVETNVRPEGMANIVNKILA